MTIVSIRGTHGSGKSSIVKAILDKYPHEAVESCGPPGSKLKTVGYDVTLPDNTILYVAGPYKTACGGCDAIQPYSDIWPGCEHALGEGCHVLLEGALVSSSYGSIGHAMNAHAPRAVFAFLDTPLEKCLDRVWQRRLAAWQAKGKPGLPEAVNPKNTSVKYDNVLRTKEQMRKLGSAIRIVDIDHTRPVQQIMKLFDIQLRKEPS